MIRKFWMLAAALLTLGFAQSPAIAQSGPPTSGQSAAVFVTPGTVELVAGLNGAGATGNGGLATAAQLNFPEGIAYDSKGNLYIADSQNYEVRMIDSATGNISVFAGTGSFGNTAPAANAQATTVAFGSTTGLAVDSNDNVYFADRNNDVVWKVDTTGVITIFAGTLGTGGYTGDTGLATSATLESPYGLAFDATGNLYIADNLNNVVRIVGTNGKINTFAGNGTDAGPLPSCPNTIPALGSPAPAATSVALCGPQGVAADASGNVYISSYTYDQVYKVSTNGDISVFAGSGANYGTSNCCESGDGGPATSAELWRPAGLYADPIGDVYIVDQFGSIVREVNTAGVINKVFGDGSGGVTKAVIGTPDIESEASGVGDADGIEFITMDADGNLVVPSVDASVVLSAGSTGNYFFGYNNQLYSTSTSTSLNSVTSAFPPYITLSNPSGVTLNFTAMPTITGPFGIAGGTCSFPGSVAPGDSCTVIPSFTPTVDGAATGSIVIQSNANNASQSITKNTTPLTIALEGSGIGSAPFPAFSLTPPSLAFSSPTGVLSAAQTVTLQNTGQVPFTIYSYQIQNGPTFAVSPNTCPTAGSATTIAVGGICTFSITFTPTAPTTFAASLQVCVSSTSYSDYCNAPATGNVVSLTGTGTGTVSFTSPPLAFGDEIVGQTSGILSAALNNGGADGLTIQSITITGTNPADFTIANGTNACTVGNTLDGGGLPASTCYLYVTFKPGSVAGFGATLQVTLLDPFTSPQSTLTEQEPLSGTGVSFVSPVGTAQATQTVTVGITTAGTPATIQVLTQGESAGDFTETSGGTCSTSTAYTVGESCTVNVIFNPEKPGIREGAIELMDGSGNVFGITYLPGLGTAPLTAFAPATQTSLLPASTYTAFGIAASAGGNIFFTDNAGGAVYQMNKSGANLTQIASGLTEPVGVAVDGAGNVYVGGYATGEIVKIPWTGSAYGTKTTVPLGSTSYVPYNLTVDGSGNIFFIDYVGSGPVMEVPWTSTGYGSPIQIPFTGLTNGSGVAVDQNGDVFVADSYGHQVLELPWTGTGWGTQVTVVSSSNLESGVGAPVSLTLDPAGDLYIAEEYTGFSGTENLLKVPFNGTSYGTPVVIPMKNLGAITGVALLGSGDIFVADRLSQQVYALDTQDPPTLTFKTSTAVGSTDTTDGPQTATVTNIGNAPLTLNSGTNPTYPTNFPANTLDTNLCASAASILPAASCDISVNFIPNATGANAAFVDLLNNDLNAATSQKIPVTGNGSSPATVPVASLSPTPTLAFTPQLDSTTSLPSQVTLSNTGNGPLSYSIALSGAGFASVSGATDCGATGTLAAGGSCYIYVTFTPTSATAFSGTLQVTDTVNTPNDSPSITVTGTGVSFVSSIGTAEAAQPVTVNITTAGTLSTIQALTLGQANLDFTSTAGGTCTTTTVYSVGDTCTVNVIFNPQFAGTRNGAILLTDSGGNVLSTTYVTGTGYGPQSVFGPGVLDNESLSTGAQIGPGVAVDAAGNLYLNNTLKGTVVQIPWNGTTYGTAVTIATEAAFTNAESIAVDGAGNVYVGTQQTNEVLYKIPWNGSAWGTPILIPTKGVSPSNAFGVAVDWLGNVYFVDRSNDLLVKVPWTGSTYGSATSLTVTGMTTPFGVAVDGSLNVYVADTNTNTIYMLPWTGSGYGTQTTVPLTGLTLLTGIAVDGDGDVYVAGTSGSTSVIVEIPWNGNSYNTQFTLPGTTSATVAVDGAGNVYGNSATGVNHTSSILKIDLADPPSLTFATTNVGSTSTDSPQTVTVTNIGNRSLYLPIPSTGNNPSFPADFPLDNGVSNICEEDDSYSQGESCAIPINFTPTVSGPLTENVVLTDTTLNSAGATQIIQVSGNATAATLTPQTINFTQPTSPITWSSGLTVALVATGGASGNPVTFSIDGTSTGTGNISGSTLSITTPGTFVIDANQAGNASYSAAPQVQRTIVVNKAPQTINFTPPTSPVTYSAGLTISLVATGGASGNPVTFSIEDGSTATGSISGSTLTVTSTGTLVIDANQAGNTDYASATQVQQTIVVSAIGTQAITFTQPTTPIVYAPSLTVALVATGGASGNAVVFTLDGTSTGAGSISGSTLTITSVGSFVIDANQAGNANYSAAPQVQRTLVVTQAPQVINFTAPTSPLTYTAGLTITLTATGGASGNAVVFSIDSTSTASATVSGNTVTVSSVGTVVIDANQAGNADYSAAPQVQQTVVVNAAPGDFSISASPGSQLVLAGSTASYTVTVNSINSFSNSVALSVTGYPPGSTVTFSPPQINPGDGPATSTLSIATPAGLFSQAKPSSLWPIATPTLALLLLLPFRRWRKAFRGRLLMLVLGLASLATAAALTGCGGGFALPQVSQSYTLTITGTSGSDTHTTTVQLTVQ